MASTFETVAGIISETADIPREQITPESYAIEDLGIDSLAFLDIAFAIDKAFGIKLPLEQWTQEVNEGKAPAEEYFVLKNLVARIDALVAAKQASSPLRGGVGGGGVSATLVQFCAGTPTPKPLPTRGRGNRFCKRQCASNILK